MSAPAYDSYKESGVEWLGAIPLNWQTMRLGRLLARAFNGTTTTQVEPSEATVPVTRIETISGGRLNLNKVGHIPQSEAHPNMRLRAGDILFSHINSLSMIGNCAIFLGGEPLYAGMNLLTLRPATDVHAGWLHWVLQASSMRQIIAAMAKPAINQASIPQSSLLSVATPVPLPAEQAAIAAFLDRETGKIDALVEAQTRLIELLKEKRQAVISHAVTKGLDPAAPMKNSGVEWLGQVPAHWEVCLLKRAFDGTQYGISESLQADGAVAVLRMGNIEGGRVSFDDLKFVDTVDPSLLLQSGDLLFNRTNSLDQIGKVGMVRDIPEHPVTFASYLVRLRLKDDCVASFMSFFLNTRGVLGQARARAFVAIGQCNLNPIRYGEMVVVLPPPEEQALIAADLRVRSAKLDALVQEAESAILLLAERRAALISAAVTGKIDVRGLALEKAEAA